MWLNEYLWFLEFVCIYILMILMLYTIFSINLNFLPVSFNRLTLIFFHFIFQKIFSRNLVTYLSHPSMPKMLENDWFPDVFKHFHHSITMLFIASLFCMSAFQTWTFSYGFLLFFSLFFVLSKFIYILITFNAQGLFFHLPWNYYTNILEHTWTPYISFWNFKNFQ